MIGPLPGWEPFEAVEELQAALGEHVVYYDNYRLHSSLGRQSPVARFTGWVMSICGLAGHLGLGAYGR
jgi:transposase InsO family protein